MKYSLSLILIVCLTATFCFAQDDFTTVKADANACELNSLYFDVIRNKLADSPSARVIAKSYVGNSENSFVGEKRINYVRKFLEQSKGFDPSRLEFADAGRLDTNENPKIEFYIVQPGEVEGKLYLVTYSQPNKTPCLDCCEDERVFPQYIGSKLKRQITKQRKKRGIIKTRPTSQ
ncbi:MAG: hypothetical protein H0U81_10125 [Pyrinomonadaceae bacterium]|nr:hypothetical protein [Pyrinomonadaceae bacterium]